MSCFNQSSSPPPSTAKNKGPLKYFINDWAGAAMVALLLAGRQHDLEYLDSSMLGILVSLKLRGSLILGGVYVKL